MKKLVFKLKGEIFKWGPAPMRPFFVAEFFYGIFGPDYYRKAYPKDIEAWPNGGFIFHGSGQSGWVNELGAIQKNGLYVFKKRMLDRRQRDKVYKNWQKDLRDLQIQENKIDKLDIRALSDIEFNLLWDKFHKLTNRFWRHITVPELANYGSLPYLESELKKTIKDKNELRDAMEILTAPENPSFFKIEEFDLWKAKDLKKHAQRYFWLNNSYGKVFELSTAYFVKSKKALKTDPKKEFKAHVKETCLRKKELIKRLNLSPKIVKIANAIVDGIEWQDDRKKEIWIYLHYKARLLREACQRLKISYDDLTNFREVEISQMLKGDNLLFKDINLRKLGTGVICVDKVIMTLSPEESNKYWDLYIEPKIADGLKEVTGIVASKGTQSVVRGKIRILLNPYDIESMAAGEILVAPMTTPEYVFAMKKSAAIITDVGGLTSHAAIVSRELKIPCIIGTKIATKVLKDGDLVEVDADKGVVTILNKGSRLANC